MQPIGSIALLVRDHDEAIACHTDASGFELIEDSPREDYGIVAVFEDLYGNRRNLLERTR